MKFQLCWKKHAKPQKALVLLGKNSTWKNAGKVCFFTANILLSFLKKNARANTKTETRWRAGEKLLGIFYHWMIRGTRNSNYCFWEELLLPFASSHCHCVLHLKSHPQLQPQYLAQTHRILAEEKGTEAFGWFLPHTAQSSFLLRLNNNFDPGLVVEKGASIFLILWLGRSFKFRISP